MTEEHDKLDLNYPFFSQENQEERFKDLKYKHSNTLKTNLILSQVTSFLKKKKISSH